MIDEESSIDFIEVVMYILRIPKAYNLILNTYFNMKLHLPIVLFKSIAVALLVSQPVLAFNDLGVTYGGNTYAGDFSFSFTLTAGQLGDSDTSDILALYWNTYNTADNDYFNAFTLDYTDGAIFLSVGEGKASNVGTAAAPAITENTVFTANSDSNRSATFSAPLTDGGTYTVTSQGENRKQSVSLYDSSYNLLGTVSYNGNMNGSNSSMYSLLNPAYNPLTEGVLVDDVSDITQFNNKSFDASFSVVGTVENENQAFSVKSSWTFSDDSADVLSSLSFSDVEGQLFNVIFNEKLEFKGIDSIRIENCGYSALSAAGGGIYGGSAIRIVMDDNGIVEFNGNHVSTTHYSYSYATRGGAICVGADSVLEMNNNDRVAFSNNTASGPSYGGAIWLESGSLLSMCYNTEVAFTENASNYGGAISGDDIDISLKNNEEVSFSSNSGQDGGAIDVANSTVMLNDNGSLVFSSNSASGSGSFGAAIHGEESSRIEMNGNGSVKFAGNTVTGTGGGSAIGAAIMVSESTVTLEDNSNVEFSENIANSASISYGGAVYVAGSLTMNRNDEVSFLGNKASTSLLYSASFEALGGAIFIGTDSSVVFNDNKRVSFVDNKTSSYHSRGAAIYGGSNSRVELSNCGSIAFQGNMAASPTTYGDSLGGAIYSEGNLSIRNNGAVLFEKNAEREPGNGVYRLRGIYVGEGNGAISLSSAETNSIEFRDSVYIASGSTVELNADYTDAEGVARKQQGDIIFTGKYTETHLNEILEAEGVSRTATEEEIANSRTSEINSAAALYGGALRVEDAAVLKLNDGLTVAEGSEASVKIRAAELNLGSHALSMVSGSSLALADGAKVTATEVTITTGATLAVCGSVSTAPLTEQVAALTLSEETVAGFDATRAVNTGSVSVLEGDLTLESGSLLSLDDGYLELTGDLFFDVAEGEEKIALDIAPGIITEANNQVVLFNVGGVVTFGFDALTTTADDGLVYIVKATDYFTGNRVTESMKLVYDSSTGMVYLENAAGTVPEPTTTTLSLLALAALAARRRRK